jgi:hypothetical protein
MRGGRGQAMRGDRGRTEVRKVYGEEAIGKGKVLVHKGRVVATWTKGIVVEFQRIGLVGGRGGIAKVRGRERVQMELERVFQPIGTH